MAALLIVYLLAGLLVGRTGGTSRVEIPYSTFKEQVANDTVTDITNRGSSIDGHARTSVQSSDGSQRGNDFTTTRPAYDDPGLEQLLEAHHVTVNAQADSSGTGGLILTLLLSFGPIVLLVGLFVFFARRAAGAAGGGAGLFNLGRSSARLYDKEQPGVTFADVAGVDEAKAELAEVVDFLRNPEKYQRLGGSMPKGVLLVGPPGTGKTLLARAVAGEAAVPFYSVSASEFVEMIVGVGAARVRDLFAKARTAAPAIIFIDELDAAGRSRSAAVRIGGHDEQEQTLNQILTEMDGFDSREGVIVLAATNRPDVLDSALLRPGRFDRRVTLDPPDRAGRLAILRIHSHGVRLADDVDLDRVAAMTTGLVGADLRNLVNEAALRAARREALAVAEEDFEEAFEKVLLGAERHIALSAEDRRRVAVHEAGHALVGMLVPGADPVRKVSIIPRGHSLGATVQTPASERQNYSEADLLARIATALGGRAAEQVVLGSVSTGAENDLQVVTALAREMVVHWGMSPRLGSVQYAEPDGAPIAAASMHGDATVQLIDDEVQRIVHDCLDTAMALLRSHRARLDRLAEALLSAESLDEEEIQRVTGLRSQRRRPVSVGEGRGAGDRLTGARSHPRSGVGLLGARRARQNRRNVLEQLDATVEGAAAGHVKRNIGIAVVDPLPPGASGDDGEDDDT